MYLSILTFNWFCGAILVHTYYFICLIFPSNSKIKIKIIMDIWIYLLIYSIDKYWHIRIPFFIYVYILVSYYYYSWRKNGTMTWFAHKKFTMPRLNQHVALTLFWNSFFSAILNSFIVVLAYNVPWNGSVLQIHFQMKPQISKYYFSASSRKTATIFYHHSKPSNSRSWTHYLFSST